MDFINMSTVARKPCNQTTAKMKCAICLQILPTFGSSQTGKKQRYFYKICCETLKINFEARKNQNIKFCYNCQLILKDLNKLLNKLTSIQNSIRKIETDIKAKILNCYEQKTNQCWIKNEQTDRNTKERQHFRYLAVKDLLPVIAVFKIDNSQHNVSQPELLIKSTANQIYQSDIYIPNEIIIAKIEPDNESNINIDIVKQETSSQCRLNEVIDIGPAFSGNGDEFFLSSNISENSFELKALSSDLIKNPIDGESPFETFDEIIVPDICPVLSDFKRRKIVEDLKEDSNSNYSDDENFSEFEVGDTHDSDSDYTPEPKRSKATRSNSMPTSDEGKAKDLLTVNENETSARIPKLDIKKSNKRLKSQSKRDYLQGAETKISEGKWSYRSIVYYFDEDTSLYICNACQKTRKTQAKLRAHIGNNHGVEGYGKWSFMGVPYSFNKEADKFECSVCKKYFVERCSLVRHIRDYHKEMCSSQTKYVKRVEQSDGNADHPNNNEQFSAFEVGDTHDSDSDYKPEPKRRKGIGKKSPSTRPASKAKKNTKDLLEVNHNETTNYPKPVNENTERRKKIQAKRDYLQGAETKITDGKWCYRSIVYHFDATTSLYVCSVCQKTRKTQAKLRGHIGNNHGVDGYGKWSFAGVPYSFNKEADKFVCSVCKKHFTERCSLVRHIREYHREKCKTVLKKVYFEDKLKQQKSEKADSRSKSELFSVPPVVLEEGMKWLYRGVEIRKQSSDGYFICGACQRLRKGFHSLLMHVLECHDEKARSENECKICGRQFGTSYRLKSHMEMHSEQKHICEQCGECFKFKGSLRDHISRVHEQRRPYVCEYCAKAFYTRKDCRVHVRTHTKEKPYVCEYPGCGMAFSLPATLKNHMNSKVHQS